MEINDAYRFKACSLLHLPQLRSHASTCFIIFVINSFIQISFPFPVVKKVIQLSGEPSARMQFSSSDIPNAIKKNEIRYIIIEKWSKFNTTFENFIVNVNLPPPFSAFSSSCIRRYLPIRFWVRRQNTMLRNKHEEGAIFCWAKVHEIESNYLSWLWCLLLNLKDDWYQTENIFQFYMIFGNKSWCDILL